MGAAQSVSDRNGLRFPLPAPAEQAQAAEAGSEKRQRARKWGRGAREYLQMLRSEFAHRATVECHIDFVCENECVRWAAKIRRLTAQGQILLDQQFVDGQTIERRQGSREASQNKIAECHA